jgi:hypothetical protein
VTREVGILKKKERKKHMGTVDIDNVSTVG